MLRDFVATLLGSLRSIYPVPWSLFSLTLIGNHIIIPLALVTLYRGWNRQDERHRKIARITFPLWIYVSATGVIIYWMLY